MAVSDWIGAGTSLVGLYKDIQSNKTNLDVAQKQLDQTQSTNQTALEVAKINAQSAHEALLAKQNDTSSTSHTGLYIGLGIGGLLVVGLVVFAVTRK